MSGVRLRRACLLASVTAWVMLIAGGVVGALPQMVEARIPETTRAIGAYVSAGGLLLFLASTCLMHILQTRWWALRPPPPAGAARRRDRVRG